MSQRLADLESLAARGLALVATGALLLHCRYLAVQVVDDAAISVAYAMTFAAGEGLRLTPPSPPVEGFSNPLWTLLLALAGPLRLDFIAFSRGLGMGMGVLAPLGFAAWGPVSEGRRWRLEDALGPVLVASVPAYASWISSGMETGLHALLLAVSGLWLLRALHRGRGVGWALWLGLLPLTRPEGVLYVASGALVWVLFRRRLDRETVKAALLCVAPLGLYTLFRWAYFHALLPNTYLAKRTLDFDLAAYLGSFAKAHAPLLVLFVLFAPLACAVGRRAWPVLAVAFTGAGLAFVVYARGDWMQWWRFCAPLVPALATAVASGVGVARTLSSTTPRVLALGAGTILMLLHTGTQLELSPRLKAEPVLPYGFIADWMHRYQELLAPLGFERPLIGFPDVGGLGVDWRNAEVLDVAGLASSALARHWTNPAAREDFLLSEGLPVLLAGHGPSGYLSEHPQLLRHYQPSLGTALLLQGLSPTQDPRCPGGKSAVLRMSPAELERELARQVEHGQPEEALRLWRCALTYRPSQQLPDVPWRKRQAEAAEARMKERETAGRLKEAVRYGSLATLLLDGDPRLRHRTETLRERWLSGR
jgi:hypothetical protein